jgi:predicted phosphodiesterase
MKFQILSDLHTEVAPFCLSKIDTSDALILAGDIGEPFSDEYKSLIEQASALYSYVFIVKGNHECYGCTTQKTDEVISVIIGPFKNVFYLNRTAVDIEDSDIRVIGTTLWSRVKDCQRNDISIFISDYRRIKDWHIERNNYEHRLDVEFITKETQRALRDNKRLVVVTHHAPVETGACKDIHKGSVLSSAFCTDLKTLFVSPITAWVFGHTHHSCSLLVNGIPLVSNQRGYGNEEGTGFDPRFAIDIVTSDA